MKYVALIVCHNADERLLTLVEELLAQSLPPYKILIVDNASNAATQSVLNKLEKESSIDIIFHKDNLGGAGGFKSGFDRFNSEYIESDFLITFDDDASAKSENLCQELVSAAMDNPNHLIGSLVIDINNHQKTAFPYKLPDKDSTNVEEIISVRAGIDDIKLFSGVIFPRTLTERFPGPRKELFICGDEQEFKNRMQKSGVLMKTSIAAKCYHPNSTGHTTSWMGIKVFSEINSGKYYFLVRNWVYLMKNHPTHSFYVRTRILTKTFLVNVIYSFLKGASTNGFSLFKFWSAFFDGIFERFNSHSSKSAVAYLNKVRK